MIIKSIGTVPYQSTWDEMKQFTQSRTDETQDEFWLLEHFPVYTQGQAGKAEHILDPGNIPIVQSDRGGQVTYHGPGQLVGYVLYDLRRASLGIRTLVCKLEKALINTLHHFDIEACCREGAPGVYTNNKKIASIGLRVKNGCSYHGIALNINMDITPFMGINPCGFKQLEMTQMADFIPDITIKQVEEPFIYAIQEQLT